LSLYIRKIFDLKDFITILKILDLMNQYVIVIFVYVHLNAKKINV